jgi:hypothetical protein
MKKMKKLTRKGLDELANEMPQINEIQQSELVGGLVFFNNTGTIFMGKVGESDEIRLILPNEYPYGSGIGLTQASSYAQYNVVSFYAQTCVTSNNYSGFEFFCDDDIQGFSVSLSPFDDGRLFVFSPCNTYEPIYNESLIDMFTSGSQALDAR